MNNSLTSLRLKLSSLRHFSLCHFFGLAALVCLSGCTTLSLNVPGPLIESPEIGMTPGRLSFGLGVDDATRYTYTNNASSRPPTLDQPEVNGRAAYLFARGGYAVSEWLEFSGRLIPGDAKNLFLSGVGLSARAQVVGVGEESGLKVSIYGGIFGVQSDASGDQDGTFGPGGHNWRANARAFVSTAGTSVGYRFTSANGPLIYLAGSYADQSLTGKIDHDRSDNGLSPAASYTLPDIKASTRTAALGVRFGQRVQLGLEARAVHRSWPGTSVPETRGGGESTEGVFATSLYFQ